MAELYGIIEAQRRYRGWMPLLRTPGQRTVLGALLGFYSMDGTCTPSASQLAEVSGLHPESVWRILDQLEKVGALMRVGTRPRFDANGVAQGGGIPVRCFTPIATSTSESSGGIQSHFNPNRGPLQPKRGPTSTSEGSPLNIEKLKEAELPKREIPGPEWFEEFNRKWAMDE